MMTSPAESPPTARAHPVVAYLPGSALRRPRELFADMRRDLWAARGLAWRLFVRNTSARYRQSLFGYAWAIAPPLVSTAAFLFLRRSGVFAFQESGVPYALFLLTGVVLWQTFVEALGSPLRMVNQSRDMLAKVNFPREALVLAGVAEVLLNFLVRGALLAAALVWFSIDLSPSAFLFPLALAALVGVGLAIGLLLVPLGVLYQDVEHALGVATALWFFVTPVVYAAPNAWPGVLTATVNPAGVVLDTTRAWLLGTPALHVESFLWTVGGAFAILLVGWLLYRLALPLLIERMSA